MLKEVPEIVLTGGPCAGKSTGLNYLQEKLQDRGVRVFSVPESATMIIGGGVYDFSLIIKQDPRKYFQVQRQIVLLQFDLQRRFNALAAVFPYEKRVIIYDRGIMDAAAYMSEKSFRAVLKEAGVPITYTRDNYEAVIHLVTAANGAEQFYTLENNPARQETSLEAACLADERTLKVWIGHPHLKIIDNSTGFEKKMKRLLAAASRALGIPVPLEIERKFLLSQPNHFSCFKNIQRVFIEQAYLIPAKNKNETVRIRKRSQGDYSVYYKTIKSDVLPTDFQRSGERIANVRQETENTISAADYLHLMTFQDPSTDIIKKHRHCFVYKNQYFELDQFLEPPRLSSLWLLEIELTEENDNLELPPFLKITKEVTNNPSFTNFSLAKKQ